MDRSSSRTHACAVVSLPAVNAAGNPVVINDRTATHQTRRYPRIPISPGDNATEAHPRVAGRSASAIQRTNSDFDPPGDTFDGPFTATVSLWNGTVAAGFSLENTSLTRGARTTTLGTGTRRGSAAPPNHRERTDPSVVTADDAIGTWFPGRAFPHTPPPDVPAPRGEVATAEHPVAAE